MTVLIQSSLYNFAVSQRVLYFLSCTINPILYNLLSRKFRQAFKRTLCRCCLGFDVHSIPVLYKLKAKFVDGEGGRQGPAAVVARGDGGDEVGNALLGARGAAAHHRLYSKPACFRWAPEKGSDIQLAHMRGGAEGDHIAGGNPFNAHACRMSSRRCKKTQPAMKETTRASQSSSSSGAHAHSDGRLHRICRHKYCPNGRAGFGEGLTPPSVRTQSTSSGMKQQMTPVSAFSPTYISGNNSSPTSDGSNRQYDDSDIVQTFTNGAFRTVRLIHSHPNIIHCAKDKGHRTKCRISGAFSY
ncbi:neuromedin-U receptor 2 [Elysia marginata]|uniref:Neuromedin-U receptor 2 n=1 Tax=Elysia marginata TaxID=1093978 RepID=A0AAV4H312_9GAST|nr:neuromedin-U receptor 2 [Elysia marginata]